MYDFRVDQFQHLPGSVPPAQPNAPNIQDSPASGSWDATIRLWDVKEKQQIVTLER
jgi:hypothetical protein